MLKMAKVIVDEATLIEITCCGTTNFAVIQDLIIYRSDMTASPRVYFSKLINLSTIFQ